ncbi:MAG: serine/threonine protein kinase/response regulator/adenylate cyclase, partial [Pseudomonadota bacterium]
AAMNQGAFDFLCKPLDFSDLETTIEKCVVHVHELREALRSREENQLLRVLVGHGVVDRFLASVRATDNLGCRIFDATVAYVDVAKFSNVLANAQPQSVLAHLNTHFDLFVAELAARGGVVSRFVGDAVVAIFEGEDHLERAIEACLAVAARARTLDPVAARGIIGECAITVGVDTGPVIAGGIGSKGLGRIEHTVIGTPVSTAARLQSVAQPNEILITSAVEQRLAGLYVCEMVGERALRSGEEPATLFHIVGLQRPSYVRRVDSTRDLIEPTIVLPARIQSKSTS